VEGDRLRVTVDGRRVADLPMALLRQAWEAGFEAVVE
jgi:hypothetical protein